VQRAMISKKAFFIISSCMLIVLAANIIFTLYILQKYKGIERKQTKHTEVLREAFWDPSSKIFGFHEYMQFHQEEAFAFVLKGLRENNEKSFSEACNILSNFTHGSANYQFLSRNCQRLLDEIAMIVKGRVIEDLKADSNLERDSYFLASRDYAIGILSSIEGNDVARLFVPLLEDESGYIRGDAAATLGRRLAAGTLEHKYHKIVKDKLMYMVLNDPDKGVRISAASSLISWEPKAALKCLIDLSEYPPAQARLRIFLPFDQLKKTLLQWYSQNEDKIRWDPEMQRITTTPPTDDTMDESFQKRPEE